MMNFVVSKKLLCSIIIEISNKILSVLKNYIFNIVTEYIGFFFYHIMEKLFILLLYKQNPRKTGICLLVIYTNICTDLQSLELIKQTYIVCKTQEFYFCGFPYLWRVKIYLSLCWFLVGPTCINCEDRFLDF